MRVKLAGICSILFFLIPGAAWPAFHLMKVKEVFAGTPAAPNAHYVLLQMFAAGQTFVSGHSILVFDASGTQIGASFPFLASVANGANQATILIATPEAEAFFSVTADLGMTAVLPPAGGKVCFDTIDCVAWGNYTGSATGVGTPFSAFGGIPTGRAVQRRLDLCGVPTVLDGCDDTGDSATDFIFAPPAPFNNAGVPGTIPGSTCGNGVIEGLEQCDDNNTGGGDGCSATCLFEADLSLTKSGTPDPVVAGALLTYTLTLLNSGPNVALGATLSDLLSGGTTFESLTAPGGWICTTPPVGAAGTVFCGHPGLAAGSATFDLVVATDPAAAAGSILNTADALSLYVDPGSSNASATTNLITAADLAVTKTALPDPVDPGGTLTYTITVTNAGASNAANATLTDLLPAQTTFASLLAVPGWACSTPAVGSGGTVTCSNPSLSPGLTVFTLGLTVDSATSVGTTISNTATVAATTNDPNPGNENGNVSVNVQCTSDTQAPLVTPPAPLTLGHTLCSGGQAGATGASAPVLAGFLAGGSATDNCDAAPALLPPQVSGVDADGSTLFPLGATLVTFRFQDSFGNIGAADSSVTVTLFYGNLNEDGALNAGDAVILSNFLVGNLVQGSPPFTAPLAAADVDLSTTVNAVDAVLIANRLVGNIACLP